MFENGKMRSVETIPGLEGRERENDGGVNSSKIYCKNLIDVTMYSQHNNNNNKTCRKMSKREEGTGRVRPDGVVVTYYL
jgi:hypothetical protein